MSLPSLFLLSSKEKKFFQTNQEELLTLEKLKLQSRIDRFKANNAHYDKELIQTVESVSSDVISEMENQGTEEVDIKKITKSVQQKVLKIDPQTNMMMEKYKTGLQKLRVNLNSKDAEVKLYKRLRLRSVSRPLLSRLGLFIRLSQDRWINAEFLELDIRPSTDPSTGYSPSPALLLFSHEKKIIGALTAQDELYLINDAEKFSKLRTTLENLKLSES